MSSCETAASTAATTTTPTPARSRTGPTPNWSAARWTVCCWTSTDGGPWKSTTWWPCPPSSGSSPAGGRCTTRAPASPAHPAPASAAASTTPAIRPDHCCGSPRRPVGCTLGSVSSTPIVVHPPADTGGRRVTVHSHGRDEILGTAYSDHDLVVFLEGRASTMPTASWTMTGGSSGAAAAHTSGVLPEDALRRLPAGVVGSVGAPDHEPDHGWSAGHGRPRLCCRSRRQFGGVVIGGRRWGRGRGGRGAGVRGGATGRRRRGRRRRRLPPPAPVPPA